MVTIDQFEGSVEIHQAGRKEVSERKGYLQVWGKYEWGHGGMKDYGTDEKSKWLECRLYVCIWRKVRMEKKLGARL